MKKTVRIKWTKDEEEEIRRLPKENFQKGICPRQKDCNLAISKSRAAGGLIHKRYWETLKKKVSHMITKR